MFSLVEFKLFTYRAGQLAPVPDGDLAISRLTWVIAYMPDSFPFVENGGRLRCGKVGPVPMEDGSLVDVLILFSILGEDVVEMMSIETSPH